MEILNDIRHYKSRVGEFIESGNKKLLIVGHIDSTSGKVIISNEKYEYDRYKIIGPFESVGIPSSCLFNLFKLNDFVYYNNKHNRVMGKIKVIKHIYAEDDLKILYGIGVKGGTGNKIVMKDESQLFYENFNLKSNNFKVVYGSLQYCNGDIYIDSKNIYKRGKVIVSDYDIEDLRDYIDEVEISIIKQLREMLISYEIKDKIQRGCLIEVQG